MLHRRRFSAFGPFSLANGPLSLARGPKQRERYRFGLGSKRVSAFAIDQHSELKAFESAATRTSSSRIPCRRRRAGGVLPPPSNLRREQTSRQPRVEVFEQSCRQAAAQRSTLCAVRYAWPWRSPRSRAPHADRSGSATSSVGSGSMRVTWRVKAGTSSSMST